MNLVHPVCKMVLEDKDVLDTFKYMENTYYFCSEACKEHFEKDPLEYLFSGGYFIPPEE
jgi:YHS domain-containing protein